MQAAFINRNLTEALRVQGGAFGTFPKEPVHLRPSARIRMKSIVLCLGLACAAGAATAQQRVPATLSLADALAIAQDHNPLYRETLNNRGPAAWATRNAFANLIIPQVTAQGSLGYSGTGSQRFLTSNFSQSYATVSSSYSLGLDWTLSGSTLSQPGLQKAQLSAADADIDGARATLDAGVTQQYLTVLQARDNVGVAEQLLARDQEFLRLAQARYDVGQATLIDVRQAQVALGQAQVGLLRARTTQRVEKLRLFEQMGVSAPTAVDSVQLTDTFAIANPAWKLDELLSMAEAQNPSLAALRARERSASWGVKAAASSWGPALSLSAGWSGFTQAFARTGDRAADRGESGLLHAADRVPVRGDPGHEPRGGTRAAAAGHRSLQGRLGHLLRAAGRAGDRPAGGDRLHRRRLRLPQGCRRAGSGRRPPSALTGEEREPCPREARCSSASAGWCWSPASSSPARAPSASAASRSASRRWRGAIWSRR